MNLPNKLTIIFYFFYKEEIPTQVIPGGDKSICTSNRNTNHIRCNTKRAN